LVTASPSFVVTIERDVSFVAISTVRYGNAMRKIEVPFSVAGGESRLLGW
jgi:hypothetical protein